MPTMEQIQPYTPLIVMALNGLIAGWLAGLLFGGGGLIRNLIVGIIGAFVGGALVRYEYLQLPAALTNVTSLVPYGTQIVISTIGAAIVIIIAQATGRFHCYRLSIAAALHNRWLRSCRDVMLPHTRSRTLARRGSSKGRRACRPWTRFNPTRRSSSWP